MNVRATIFATLTSSLPLLLVLLEFGIDPYRRAAAHGFAADDLARGDLWTAPFTTATLVALLDVHKRRSVRRVIACIAKTLRAVLTQKSTGSASPLTWRAIAAWIVSTRSSARRRVTA
jgi:hypothetical protein